MLAHARRGVAKFIYGERHEGGAIPAGESTKACTPVWFCPHAVIPRFQAGKLVRPDQIRRQRSKVGMKDRYPYPATSFSNSRVRARGALPRRIPRASERALRAALPQILEINEAIHRAMGVSC
jgi:hypothetical protein